MKKLSSEQMANNWGGKDLDISKLLICAYKLVAEGECFNMAVFRCSGL